MTDIAKVIISVSILILIAVTAYEFRDVLFGIGYH